MLEGVLIRVDVTNQGIHFIDRLPHLDRDILVGMVRDQLRCGPSRSIFYVVPSGRRGDYIERKLAEDGALLPVIGQPASIAAYLYAVARPGHRTIPIEHQKILLQRILEDLWSELGHFPQGAARPSQGLVDNLSVLFRTLRGQGGDLSTALGGRTDLSPKDRDLLRIWDAFFERMGSAGVLDIEGAMTWLVDNDPHALIEEGLVYIDSLPPELRAVERSFLRWLCEHASRAVVRRVGCRGMTKVFGDLADEGPTFTATGGDHNDIICAGLFRTPSQGIPDLENVDGKVEVITAPERRGEMEAVASKVRELIESGVGPGDIAVVLPDPNLYASLMEDVFVRYGIHFSPSVGRPLLGSGPGRALFFLLDAVRSAFGKDEVERAVRSPYISFWSDVEGEPTRLDRSLLHRVAGANAFDGGRDGWARAYASWERMHRLRSEDTSLDEGERERSRRAADHANVQALVLRSSLDALLPLGREQRLTGFVTAVREVVGRFGIHSRVMKGEDDVMADDAHALAALDRALDDLSRAVPLVGDAPRDRDSLHAAFRLLASTSRFHTAQRRTDVVQAMGIIEAQATSHEHVLICGLVEGLFPVSRPPGILPDDQDALTGLVDHACDLRAQRYQFLQAITSARAGLHLSRPLTLDEDEVNASVLLDEMMRVLGLKGHEHEVPVRTWRHLLTSIGSDLARGRQDARDGLLALTPDMRSQVLRAAHVEVVRHEALCPTAAATMPASEMVYTGVISDDDLRSAITGAITSRYYSPTMIGTYNSCPFRFLATYVLRLREREEPSTDVSSADLGNLVHDSLARFHEQVMANGPTFEPGRRTELISLLKSTVDSVVAEIGGRSVTWELVARGLCAEGERPGPLVRWLDDELGRDGMYRPRYNELSFGRSHGTRDPSSVPGPIMLQVKGKEVPFSGKVDRIDIDERTGDAMVLDYKTSGRSVPENRDMVAGRKVQLMLYPLMVATAAREGLLPEPPSRLIASGTVLISRRDAVRRKLLCLGDEKKGIKDAGDSVYRATLDEMIRVGLESVHGALSGMGSGRFPPNGDSKDAGCRYCAAKDICRHPGVKVGPGW